MKFNINTDALVKHANRLEKLHKSALPSAIRGALNDTAFDVKTRTMPNNASKTFVNRSKNFFKANSRFEKAIGFNVDSMKSEVGFVESNLKGENNFSVKDLQQQEHGGIISGRSFIPLPKARKGNSNSGLVRANARISKIKNIKKTSSYKGNTKQKFLQAAMDAGKGGYVLSGKKNILFKVDVFLTKLKTKQTRLKVTPIYKFNKSGKVKVSKTDFMKESSLESNRKMEDFYIKQVKRQVEKFK